MNHHKYILLFSFIIFNQTNFFAQNSLSTTSFLATATQQKTIQLANEKLAFQINQDMELPWLEELEIRTETNDFLWKQQEYTVRIQPNTIRQRKAQQSYNNAVLELTKTEQELLLKKALFSRYEWLVEWLKLDQEIIDKEALAIIYQDKLTVVQQSINNLDFDVTDLVKAEEDILENKSRIVQLKAEKAILINTFKYLSNGNNSFDFDKYSIISIDKMINKMTVQSLDSLNSLALERRKNKIDILDKETEIELSEIHNPINYAQVKAGGNGDDFREFVSIGVGIKIPLKGDKKIDLNELDLERLEENNDYLILQEKLVYEQRQLVESVRQLQSQKQFLQKQLDNSQAVFVLNRLLELDESKPSDILDLKEIILKKEQKIKQIDFEILERYVEWLAVSNTMMNRPLQNHLSVTQDSF